MTAAFNLNILKVVNQLASTDFEPEAFEHVAFYNRECQRIEMHLRASREMSISSPHLLQDILVKEGETIHTENSHKFTDIHIQELGKASGLDIDNIFSDEENWFSLVQFIKG